MTQKVNLVRRQKKCVLQDKWGVSKRERLPTGYSRIVCAFFFPKHDLFLLWCRFLLLFFYVTARCGWLVKEARSLLAKSSPPPRQVQMLPQLLFCFVANSLTDLKRRVLFSYWCSLTITLIYVFYYHYYHNQRHILQQLPMTVWETFNSKMLCMLYTAGQLRISNTHTYSSQPWCKLLRRQQSKIPFC